MRHSNSKCAGWRQKRIKQKFCGEQKKKKKWHARQLAVAAEIDSRKWHISSTIVLRCCWAAAAAAVDA